MPPSLEAPPRSVWGHIRSTLLTGLALVLPLVVTVWVFSVVVLPLDRWLQPLLTRAVGRPVPGLGLLTLLVLLYLAGLVGRNVLGRMAFNMLESFLRRVPGASTVYTATKELLAAFSLGGDGTTAFREVCLIEYPRTGIFGLGFVTSRLEVTDADGARDAVTVFVPNPPNPATGQFVIVPAGEVIAVDLSVEEGIKMVLSGGLVAPAAIRRQPRQEEG